MLHATMQGIAFEPRNTVRIAVAGLGSRGRSLLRDLTGIPHTDIVALCDLDPASLALAEKIVLQSNRPAPRLFTDYTALCRESELDLLYIASHWDAHAPMAIEAMEGGFHVGLEVPAATTLEDCWAIVEASERTRRHCILLENCIYGELEMLLYNIVQAGVLGTVTHGGAAYIHYLRDFLFQPERRLGNWRRKAHQTQNGNLYPTHGLGPIARCMKINRGDRFTRLVSMSSLEASLSEYRDAELVVDAPERSETYQCGDINLSLLQTAKGRTVLLEYNIVTPRPYSRGTLLQGTKGTFRDFPPGVFFTSSPDHSQWEPIDALREQYSDPLWQQYGELARQNGGHGGMDYIMSWRLVQSLREGLVPDTNVYDAVTWSAPTPLSRLSVEQSNNSVDFPDFTRGHWS